MIDNIGVRGIDLISEMYEQQAIHVEEFFETAAVDVPDDKRAVHLVREEYAVIDIEKTKFEVIGTSGLDFSVAVFLVASFTNRIGLVHFARDKMVTHGMGSLISVLLENYEADSDGVAAGAGARRRVGPVIEAHIVGGFQDPGNVCEGIVRQVLDVMMGSEARFVIKLGCTGLLNDSSHNGNEEDMNGPRCALFTSFCMDFKRNNGGNLNTKLSPVGTFEDRGPGLTLRQTRLFNIPDESTVLPTTTVTDENNFLWNAFCTDSDRFMIEPFVFDVLDRQSLGILLHLTHANTDELIEFISEPKVSHHNFQVFIQDLAQVFRFLLKQPSPEQIFKKRPLYFSIGKGGKKWVVQPYSRIVAPLVLPENQEKAE
eukprot:CAMPEP_0203755582 /NCGR_PEP_ID=MMETSP0098-20131031/9005_1 /ASSEMBLY_ACC=CAM_ASM_000208 /TAXON_ID=96639 /ORGANISM=" , Strain NY0313808BC1" /LENGTH=370 /DNA_ID=CAMNT_0050647109 /DNA_START=31 /DNA_END=1140 /DNA_ORIENTATION=-